MIFLDTSFIYAYLVKGDIHHNEALKLFNSFEDGVTFKLTQDVLKELLTVATYKISSLDAIKLFDYVFTNVDVFEIVYDDYSKNFDETMVVFKSLGKHKFSYTDCSLLAFAKSLRCTVLTFDKNLEKALKVL